MIFGGRSGGFITTRFVQFTAYVVTGVRSTLRFRNFSSPTAVLRPPSSGTNLITFDAPGELLMGDIFIAGQLVKNFQIQSSLAIYDFLPRQNAVELCVPWTQLHELASNETELQPYQPRRILNETRFINEDLDKFLTRIAEKALRHERSIRDQSLNDFIESIFQEIWGIWEDEECDENTQDEDQQIPREIFRPLALRIMETVSAHFQAQSKQKAVQKRRKALQPGKSPELRLAIWNFIGVQVERGRVFTLQDLCAGLLFYAK